VIALGVGGALDSVVPGETGVHYLGGVPELAEAMRAFEPDQFDSAVIRRHAEAFSPAAFRAGFTALATRALEARPGARG
jgi:hypothetical protein